VGDHPPRASRRWPSPASSRRAAALEILRRGRVAGFGPMILISADQALDDVVIVAGMAGDDPRSHPEPLGVSSSLGFAGGPPCAIALADPARSKRRAHPGGRDVAARHRERMAIAPTVKPDDPRGAGLRMSDVPGLNRATRPPDERRTRRRLARLEAALTLDGAARFPFSSSGVSRTRVPDRPAGEPGGAGGPDACAGRAEGPDTGCDGINGPGSGLKVAAIPGIRPR
jgi:hypothetical protein